MQYRNILCEFGHNLMAFSYAHPPGGGHSASLVYHMCVPKLRVGVSFSCINCGTRAG